MQVYERAKKMNDTGEELQKTSINELITGGSAIYAKSRNPYIYQVVLCREDNVGTIGKSRGRQSIA